MQTTNILRGIIIFIILAINVGCDQLSKSMVRQKVAEHEQVSIIKNYFIITKVENAGAFLSIGDSWPDSVRFIFLSLFPLTILGFGLGFLFTRTSLSKTVILGYSFVIGGGIGNVYDRLVFGSVTDFLHIDFVIFETGVFNMADVSIMTGMLLVVLSSFSKKKIREDSITPVQ